MTGRLSCQAWRKISSGDGLRSRRAGNSEKPGPGGAGDGVSEGCLSEQKQGVIFRRTESLTEREK